MRRARLQIILGLFFGLAFQVGVLSLLAQPVPDVRVLARQDKFEEWMRDDLVRYAFYELQDQIVSAIQEQVFKLERGEPLEGASEDESEIGIRNTVDIRPFEPFFDQYLIVNSRLEIAQELPLGAELSDEDLRSFGEGFQAMTREQFLVARLRSAYLQFNDHQTSPWIEDSIDSWAEMIRQLKFWRMIVDYRVDIDPGVERLELEVARPGELDRNRDAPYLQGRPDQRTDWLRENAVVEGRARARLNPSVRVLSFTGYIQDSSTGHIYELPLFPDYAQTWLFQGVEAQVGVGVHVDFQEDQLVSVNFGQFMTNLRESFDSDGRLLHPGIRLPEADRDHFLKELFVLGRFAFLLEQLTRPEDPQADLRSPEEPAPEPLFRRAIQQLSSDVGQFFSSKSIPVVIWIEEPAEGGSPRARVDVLSEARQKYLEALGPSRLVNQAVFQIPLRLGEDGAKIEYLNDQMAFRISADLPNRQALVAEILEMRAPKVLQAEVTEEIASEVLEVLTVNYFSTEEARLVIRALFPDHPDDPTGDFEVILPLNWRSAEASFLSEQEREEVLARLEDFQNFDLESPWDWGPTGLPQIDTDLIQVQIHSLRRGRALDVNFEARRDIPPIPIDLQTQDVASQLIRRTDLVVEHMHALFPPEAFVAADAAATRRLQREISGVSGSSQTEAESFDYSIVDFKLGAQAFHLDWMLGNQAVRDLEVFAIDLADLPESARSLYEAEDLKRFRSQIELPSSIRIRLDDADSPAAHVEFIEFTIESPEALILDIEWALVMDAEGEPYLLPVAHNFDQVFDSFQVVTGTDSKGRSFRYGKVSPKARLEASAVNVVELVTGQGGRAARGIGSGIRDVSTIAEGAYDLAGRDPVVRSARRAAEHYIPSSRAALQRVDRAVETAGLIGRVTGPVLGWALQRRVERTVREPFYQSQVDPVVHSNLIGALPLARDPIRQALLEAAFVAANGDRDEVSGERDPEAPIPFLFRQFQDELDRLHSLFPFTQEFGEIQVGDQDLASRAESELRSMLVRAFGGSLREEESSSPVEDSDLASNEESAYPPEPADAAAFMPEVLTNAGFMEQLRNLRSLLGEEISRLVPSNASAIESEQNLEITASRAATEAVNAPIQNALREPLKFGETELFVCLGGEPAVSEHLIGVFAFAGENPSPDSRIETDPSVYVAQNMEEVLSRGDFSSPLLVGLNLDFIVREFIEPEIPGIEKEIIKMAREAEPFWTNNSLRVDLKDTKIEVRRDWFYNMDTGRWDGKDRFVLTTQLRVRQDTRAFDGQFLLFDVPLAVGTLWQANVHTGRDYLPIEVDLDIELVNAWQEDSKEWFDGYELRVRSLPAQKEKGDRYYYIADQRRGGSVATKIARSAIDKAIGELDVSRNILRDRLSLPLMDEASELVLGSPIPIHDPSGSGYAAVAITSQARQGSPEIRQNQSLVFDYRHREAQQARVEEWLLREGGYLHLMDPLRELMRNEVFETEAFRSEFPQLQIPSLIMREPRLIRGEGGQLFFEFVGQIGEGQRPETEEDRRRQIRQYDQLPALQFRLPVHTYRYRNRDSKEEAWDERDSVAFGEMKVEKLRGSARQWEVIDFEFLQDFRRRAVPLAPYNWD